MPNAPPARASRQSFSRPSPPACTPAISSGRPGSSAKENKRPSIFRRPAPKRAGFFAFMNTQTQTMKPPAAINAQTSALTILFALSFSHLLNDAIQALLPAIYPLLKQSFALTFTQIGLITLTFQMVGSVFQPVVGMYTDRNPKPFSLVAGMTITLCGLILL